MAQTSDERKLTSQTSAGRTTEGGAKEEQKPKATSDEKNTTTGETRQTSAG